MIKFSRNYQQTFHAALDSVETVPVEADHASSRVRVKPPLEKILYKQPSSGHATVEQSGEGCWKEF